MKVSNHPKRLTQLAGIIYLLIIITGILGELFVRSSIIIGDAAATFNNLTNSASLWQWGIAGDILMHVLDIPLMVILYFLFRPVNKHLALLGVLFNIIQTAICACNKLLLLLPQIISENTSFQEAFTTEQIQAVTQLSLDIHNYGFGLGLIFFGLACMVYGYLLFKSTYFPKFLGVMISLAGFSYLINTGALFFMSDAPENLFLILLVPFIAELTFALWLLFKGVNLQKWNHATNSSIG